MKITVFNTKAYEKSYFNALKDSHELSFIEKALSLETVEEARNADGICCFVTDCLNKPVLEKLVTYGTKLIALRSAGYDHVDMAAAHALGITVVRVPKYSPEAIAEFTVALILNLSRQLVKSHHQVLQHNFSLDELMGFNLYKKTIGIIGTGNIGTAFAKIMKGFGCHLLAVDPFPNETCRELGVHYVDLEYLLKNSDIVSLHCPLNKETHYLINKTSLASFKKGAMLINTGRGGLCNTRALIESLSSGHLGYAGLDVYENEHDLFFRDHSHDKIHDEVFFNLQSLPNVIITPHQAFLTEEAVQNIVRTTLENITAFEQGNPVNTIDF